MVALTLGLISVLSLAWPAQSQQSPPGPGTGDAKGTSFLDHDALVSDFAGQTFLKENIPFIDIPDKNIQDVYYYRWTSTQRNLRYVMAGIGYMSTEFVQPVGYAQAFGTIVAAAGHQLDESKWLRSRYYSEDYMNLYNRGPANSTQYTEWVAYVNSQRALVTGDNDFFTAQLDDMVRAFREWDKVFDTNAGLYYYQPVWDAQELSLAGFVSDPDGADWDLRKDGPDTYRPSHNAYMFANARAIARAANLAGNSNIESEFTDIADAIDEAMTSRLWDANQSFFSDIIRPDNPDLAPLVGRQQVGLFPYRFGIGLTQELAQPAIDAMFDEQGFMTPYGPTTLEVRNEWYMPDKSADDDYCCYWNGQSWPYSTGHTISSLGSIYRSGVTNVTADQFHQYMTMYANTLHKDNQPYVAESHYPDQDSWSQDSYNHSEHYAHSTYVNNVIGDLFGVLPQPNDTLSIHPIIPSDWDHFALENLPYHGHLVTILYDATGTHYNNATKGLTIFVNSDPVHNEPTLPSSLPLTIPIPSPPSQPTTSPLLVNIAANPFPGTPGTYPVAEATYTYSADSPQKVIDGVLYYDDIPNNRWTNYESPNGNDTLTITFARPRNVSSVTLALYSDVSRGGVTDLPSRIEIYGSGGLITTVGEDLAGDGGLLLGNDRNEIVFDQGQVETSFLGINLFNNNNAGETEGSFFVGLCEVEVWVPAAEKEFFAADAFLTNAEVVFDDGDAVGRVGGLGAESRVDFSGVGSEEEGRTTVGGKVRYANSGEGLVSLDLMVNQELVGQVDLEPTGGEYKDVDVEMVGMGKGRNFVSFLGGTGDIKLEGLRLD